MAHQRLRRLRHLLPRLNQPARLNRTVGMTIVTCILATACNTPPDTAQAPVPVSSSPESVVTKLIDDPEDAAFCIYELGRFGKQALSSGPHVLPYLHSSSWQERVDAANTLGLIAYAEAIPSLVQALDIAHDWQLVFAAARSLARLGATDQVDRLKQVAAAHWYPPVRKLAGQAVDWLESGEAPTTWAWQTSRFSIWREQPPLCGDRCDAATSKASEAHPFRQGCTGIPLLCAKR